MTNTSLSPELQLALDACKAVKPTIDGEICYRWISSEFKAKGVIWHQLRVLAQRGFLRKTDQNKRGVYYRVNS